MGLFHSLTGFATEDIVYLTLTQLYQAFPQYTDMYFWVNVSQGKYQYSATLIMMCILLFHEYVLVCLMSMGTTHTHTS